MKEDWDKTFLQVAALFAGRSSCSKRKVGAVLVKDLRILSTGYNGTPKGFCNCSDIFASRTLTAILNRKTISHHEFSEKYEIHAEQNCLAFAAKNGVATKDCTLYSTTAPCSACAKLIIAAGIARVVYSEPYKNSDGLELLNEAHIEVNQEDY